MNTFERLACIDLETTGARPTRDRITEIGLVLVDGDEVIEEWSTLINPETYIPQHIQQLTGITPEMVENAPVFEEVAEKLMEMIQGRVIVAHNARFDTGFLRNALSRLNIHFRPEVVCTVKLSRKLYPQHRRHNLDSLMRRHQLSCSARHRALGDARVLPDLISVMKQELGAEQVYVAMHAQQKILSLPPHIEKECIDAIPHRPGVYLFYGENDTLLYVGKSVNLRSRVMSHFSDDFRHDREMRLAQQVRDIEWQETAGEFGALMLEAELIKKYSPLFNRKLRQQRDLFGIVWSMQNNNRPDIMAIDQLCGIDLSNVYGLFRSKKQATQVLRKLADDNALCLKQLGIEKGKGACFGYQLKKCKGVCCGKESDLMHTHRLMQALLPLKLQAWPYAGPVGIREYQPETELTDIHILYQWCYLGKVRTEDELAEFQIPGELRLDRDIYRLCLKQLKNHKDIIDLSGRLDHM